MVKTIAHGLALRHAPNPAEMWERKPAYDELDTAAFESPSDLHHFAKARMIAIGNPGFGWLFVGSMSLF
jgi:hypothetical protein